MIAVDPGAVGRGHAGAVCACGGSPARGVRIRLPSWRAAETRDLCARHEAEAREEGLVVEGGGLVKITTHPHVEAIMKPKCLVPNCTTTKLQGRGLCGRHYGALRTAGRLPVNGGPPSGADLASLAEAEADVAAHGSSLTAALAARLGRGAAGKAGGDRGAELKQAALDEAGASHLEPGEDTPAARLRARHAYWCASIGEALDESERLRERIAQAHDALDALNAPHAPEGQEDTPAARIKRLGDALVQQTIERLVRRLEARLTRSLAFRLAVADALSEGGGRITLRHVAQHAEVAFGLAADLLHFHQGGPDQPAPEEGAPPPREPIHPALVDLDGKPVHLELMGHRSHQGVLTALGGASYRIAPLDGEAVHGVWGSAIYAARAIDPEEWARAVAAHENAVRREHEAATVPRWRHLHWTGHPEGAVYVEDEGQEIGNCRLAADDEALLAFDERPKSRQGRLALCTLNSERSRTVVTVQEWGDWFTMDDDEDGNGDLPW